jgi:hypothetical protein
LKSIFQSTKRSRRHRQVQTHENQQEKQQPFFAKADRTGEKSTPQPFFQPKLAVGKPGDPFEREADAVADAVVNGGRQTVVGGGTSAVQRMPITPVTSGSLQRLATPDEEKMPATNDERMAEDKRIQEKPIQKAEENEEPVQAMEAPKEEEKPVQKAEEEEPVQAKEEEEEPVQAMEAPKEEEKPVQKAEKEEEPVQAKSDPGARPASKLGARLSRRRGSGNPLSKNIKADMEHSFGKDFSGVRIHTDSEAVGMNRELHAQAFTHGQDVYFNAGKFNPEQTEGKRLLAHELTHVVQQESPPKLRKKPAAPAGAQYDESDVILPKIPDIKIEESGGKKVALPKVSVTPTFSKSAINHLCWSFYDPSDNKLSGSFCTEPKYPNAINAAFEIGDDKFASTATQGRHRLRCTGMKDGNEEVYADSTFYVWTKMPVSKMNLSELQNILKDPVKHTLSEVGAAKARAMMLQHQESITNTGQGLYQGNQCGQTPPSGVANQDCTTYVLEVLKFAFASKGRIADWDKVFKKAQTSSQGKFKGTSLIDALVSQAGWKAVFWSPDPNEPEDKTSEHPYAYSTVKSQSTYYGIPVEKDKSVVDYKRTSPKKEEEFSNFDRLKEIPLGVIAARGGTHMTLIISGEVIEVHFKKKPDDPDVIEQSTLDVWEWQSGVVAIPTEEFNKQF